MLLGRYNLTSALDASIVVQLRQPLFTYLFVSTTLASVLWLPLSILASPP